MTKSALVILLGLAGCAHHAAPPASTTTVTSADSAWEPTSVELWAARQEKQQCAQDVPATLTFDGNALDTKSEAAVDDWAACLSSPRMRGATVVLDGGGSQADAVRDALSRRGIDPQRIVGGGGAKASDAVTLEVRPADVTPDVHPVRPPVP
ncbi:MAG TPA: hypothetical protein VIF62_30760 [Labilithrix sp.]|jgi:hypothetical protein